MAEQNQKQTVNILGKDINEDLEGENHWSIILQLLEKIEQNTRP